MFDFRRLFHTGRPSHRRRKRPRPRERSRERSPSPLARDSSAKSTSTSKRPFPVGIKLLYNSNDPLVDIVFVHGLNGHREKTWTARSSSGPWPKTLLPSELGNVRILTFGYDARVHDWRRVVSENRIGNHAANLLNSLANFRDDDDTSGRPIIFVCHSLGGLVCQDALRRSNERDEAHLKNISRHTKGVIFLGTPHHGSALATWAERISLSFNMIKQVNPEIVRVLRRDLEVLARIQDSFNHMIQTRSKTKGEEIDIICFYEELPLPNIGMVVQKDSAILPGYNSMSIHANHSQMTKFAEEDDHGFVAVCSQLKRWTRTLAVPQDDPIMASRSSHQNTPLREGNEEAETNMTQFLVPYPMNGQFVGRTAVLEQLKGELGHDADSAHSRQWSQPRASIYGLGGVGKTQIALAYAYWLRETHPGVSVFWIHANNEERFRQGYSQIARKFRVPGYDDPRTDVLRLVRDWLQHNTHLPWLMIIDNADDAHLILGKPNSETDSSYINSNAQLGRYIPTCAHGSLLITTRYKTVGLGLTKGLPPILIGSMDQAESTDLLLSRLKSMQVSSDELSGLSDRLAHLPLALAQASAFIQKNDITVARYLRLLDAGDQSTVELLSADFEADGRDAAAQPAVARTWMVSFQQIAQQSPRASELLSLMCLFDRQNIPFTFMSDYVASIGQWQSDTSTAIELEEALGVLKAFSFITVGRDGNYNMHRLVQLVTRNWLAQQGKLAAFEEKAITTLANVYPRGDFENFAICRAYLPHAQMVLSLKGRHSRKERIERAYLQFIVAGYFSEIGQYHNAQNFLEEALQENTELLGKEHSGTLTAMNVLAATLTNLGRWNEAEKLYRNVLTIRLKTLGKEHPDTLDSMGHLATTLDYLGQLEEAEELQRHVLKICQNGFGEEHADTLISKLRLAFTLMCQRKLGEAEELASKAVELGKRVHGPNHSQTVSATNVLTLIYTNQGRFEEAEQLNQLLLEMSKALLGEGHPRSLIFMNNLAISYMDLGKSEQAIHLMRDCVERMQRILGYDHVYTQHPAETLRKWELEKHTISQIQT